MYNFHLLVDSMKLIKVCMELFSNIYYLYNILFLIFFLRSNQRYKMRNQNLNEHFFCLFKKY